MRYVILLCAVVAAGFAPRADRELLIGGDISQLAQLESLGGRYSRAGNTGDAIAIMRLGGWNSFRLRLFVKPNHEAEVVNDLEYTLALARRIKASGGKLILDLHYSDTWADPQHQITPAEWQSLNIDGLERKVEEYSAEVISRFRTEGVLPDIVQVGNEIREGMLWPLGRLKHGDGEAESWDRLARLVRAGIRGVRKPLRRGDRMRVMIHIDKGGDWPATRAWFDNLVKRGVRFDLIGQSYYPWWHGTMEGLRENLRESARRYRKDIVIVETAYPSRGTPWWSRERNMAWPITPDGQRQFLADLVAAVRATPDGHGAGVIWWYPEVVPLRGLRVWHNGETGVFDPSGAALPVIAQYPLGIINP